MSTIEERIELLEKQVEGIIEALEEQSNINKTQNEINNMANDTSKKTLDMLAELYGRVDLLKKVAMT